MQLTKTRKLAFFGVFVMLCIGTPQPATAVIDDVLDILHVVKEVTTGILKAWDIVQSSSLGQSIEFPLMREKQKKVLQRLKEVSRQIDQTQEKYAQNVALVTESVSEFISENVPLMIKMNEISDMMDRISSRFKQMQQYESHQDKLETNTLITFAEWTVSPNAYSVHHMMDRLNLALLGQEEKQGNASTNMLLQLTQSYEVKTWLSD